MDQKLNDAELDRLADRVASRLPTGQYGDKFVFSRRQVMALAASGLSVGALTTLGVDEATAQEVVGQVGTDSDRVDVKAGSVDAIDGATYGGAVDHQGNDVNNVGTLEADQASIGELDGYEILIGDTNDAGENDDEITSFAKRAVYSNRSTVTNGTDFLTVRSIGADMVSGKFTIHLRESGNSGTNYDRHTYMEIGFHTTIRHTSGTWSLYNPQYFEIARDGHQSGDIDLSFDINNPDVDDDTPPELDITLTQNLTGTGSDDMDSLLVEMELNTSKFGADIEVIDYV